MGKTVDPFSSHGTVAAGPIEPIAFPIVKPIAALAASLTTHPDASGPWSVLTPGSLYEDGHVPK